MTNIIVTNTYQDVSGTPLTGTVTFTPAATANDGSLTTLIADPLSFPVTAGVLSATIKTTDTYTVAGAITYRVVERIGTTLRRRFYCSIPSSLGASVILSSLTQYSNPPNTLILTGGADATAAITALDARLDTIEAFVPMTTHVAAADPHTGYITTAEGDAAYAALSNAVKTGGTVNQVYTKQSSAANDAIWSTPSAATLTTPVTFTSTAVGQVPLTVKGFAGQTADILDVQTSASANIIAALQGGQIKIGGAPPTAGTIRVEQAATTEKGLVIKQKASGTANPIDVTDSAGTTVFSVASTGTVVAPNVGVKVLVLDAAAGIPAGTIAGTVILRRP